MRPSNIKDMGPKVQANIENKVEFKLHLFPEEDAICLLWPDGSGVRFHFDEAEMACIHKWATDRLIKQIAAKRRSKVHG